MASFSELDMVVSCLHPKLIGIAKTHLRYLKSRYLNKELLIKLLSLVDTFYDSMLLSGSDSNGNSNYISQTTFDAEVIKLNLGEQTNAIISSSFSKLITYTDQEIITIKNTLGELITNEVIAETKRNNIDSPISFVKALQEFNVDNIRDIDTKVFRESLFTDINITKLEEDIKGAVLKSSIDMVNKCSPLGGYLDRTLTMVSGKPGSGKSLFLIQEAWNFVLQGKKVLYLALGDMNEFHFITRIIGQMMKISLSNVNINFAYLYAALIKNYPILSNLRIQYFLPDAVSCSDWLSYIKSVGYYDEYDVFIIDYDTNFASDEEMYQKGETTYNALKALSDRVGKYVFVACQPKPQYFSDEILPLESGSESSRKVQIVDNMITISYPPSPGNVNHIGIINVAKYRGGSPASVPYLMDKNGRFEPISLELYSYLKITRDAITLPGSGCESICQVMSPDAVPESGDMSKVNI